MLTDPYLFLIDWDVPKHINWHWTIIPILLQSVSASSMEWVVKITELCFLLTEILWITDHINLLASGSTPVEGSSNNTIWGFPIRAVATESFLLLPPLMYNKFNYLRLPASLSAYSCKFISFIKLLTIRSRWNHNNVTLLWGIPLMHE